LMMVTIPTVWFDIEDLFHYVDAGHMRPSGIQRLTLEIYRAAYELHGDTENVRFIRHGQNGEPLLVPVSWASIKTLFDRAQRTSELAGRISGPDSALSVQNWDQPFLAWLPVDIRQPLAVSAILQLRAASSLIHFAAALVGRIVLIAKLIASGREGRPLTPPAIDASHSPFDAQVRPGDVVLALGSPWNCPGYDGLVRWLRDTMRVKFGALFHDMVPINRPEWCDTGVVHTFRTWCETVLPLCDLVLANSHHTAHQVQDWASRVGVRLPGEVRPVPVGTGFQLEAMREESRPSRLAHLSNYVLFVSTLEVRKNHDLLIKVWRALLDEEQSSQRRVGSVPKLVFAGRIGWLVTDILQQLDNAHWLEGRVLLIEGPSDTELRALYEGCLFTIFPSLHEGWGLPVTEAMALGAPVLCSSAAALPEAGGDLARYFDPNDAGDCRMAVAALLDDNEGLAAWREEVRSRFRYVSWSTTARAVLDAAWSCV
jgi:glycosyltransferase involved in cell wall biosynthesis